MKIGATKVTLENQRSPKAMGCTLQTSKATTYHIGCGVTRTKSPSQENPNPFRLCQTTEAAIPATKICI